MFAARNHRFVSGVSVLLLVGLLSGCSARRATVVGGSALPVDWYRTMDGPCLEVGKPGAFDEWSVMMPAVIYKDDFHNMRMFYCGADKDDPSVMRIGIADRPTAEDDTQWKKLSTNPVLSFGDDKTPLFSPTLLRGETGHVLREGGRIRMYVVARLEGQPNGKLYQTFSEDDGLTWTPLSGPLLENVGSLSVLKLEGLYRMWYVDTSSQSAVRYAMSEDGNTWVDGHSESVMDSVGSLFVLYDQDRYLMWYGHAGDADKGINLAYSNNGVEWRKYTNNPVIIPKQDRAFDPGRQAAHYVVPISSSSGDSVVSDGYRIYYSTSAIVTAATGTERDIKEPVVPRPVFTTSTKAPVDPRFEPLRFLNSYGQQTEPRFEFNAKTVDEWRRWRRAFRVALKDVIGMPEIDNWEIRATQGETVQCKGYKRIAFTIESAPGLFVPAYLLVPDGLTDARPAVLCSHGHGNGMNALVGLTDDGNERQTGQGYQHDFGIQSVRAGFVTLVFDQMGFGRRRDFDWNARSKVGNSCDQPSKVSLHWGMSMTGIRVYDAMRMVDFLQSRPEVDPRQIGMVGISGGGLVTQFTAALDDRIKAACVSGYCNRYEACILGIHHCIDNYVSGLGLIGNNDDVACLVAPTPLLIESGTKDPIFPIDATRAAFGKIKRCYKLIDATSNLESDLFEGFHQFSGTKTWAFFSKHLGDPNQ